LGYEDAVERVAQQGKQPQYNSVSVRIRVLGGRVWDVESQEAESQRLGDPLTKLESERINRNQRTK
jgi:hypothetical protein